mgnify:CR=1 FL=1
MSDSVFKITRTDSEWMKGMKEINLKVYNLRKIRARVESRKRKINKIYEN